MKAGLKVSRAVTKAAFSYPFWGSLMLSLGHQPDESMPTACTNGLKIYWNPEFIDTLTEEETLGLMAHEICHVIFDHCKPHDGKDPKLCNIAMDYVINNILIEDGFKLPKGGIIDDKKEFVGMTWQQVYAILDDVRHKHEHPEDADYEDGPAGQQGMSESRQKELGEQVSEMMENPDIMDVIENSDLTEEQKAELKQKVLKAASDAKAQGVGKLPGDLEELIKDIRTSKVAWQEIIISLWQSKYPEDYTYRRPNKKLSEATGLYMPSMEGTKVGSIGIGLDTSGSVSRDELIDYLSEMNQIVRQFQPEKVYIFHCDFDVAKVEIIDEGEEIDELMATGRGGTSFTPVFDYIEKEGIELDQLLFFSDMEVWDECFPSVPPTGYDTIWVSTRDDYPVPFGTVVKVHN